MLQTKRLILAVESSCDETGFSIVQLDPSGNISILSELVRTQVDLHAQYGGVVPELAAREHVKALPILCEEVLCAANLKGSDLTHVAVTTGPGLAGCLLTGVTFASGFALQHGVPLLGVNHIEAHILVTMIDNPNLQAPFLALVVSGGHTELVLVPKVGEYQVISRTRDDAAGEAFDKCASLLGFPYPGGAKLAALGDSVSTSAFVLPRISAEIPDFSFSGLKTAVALLIKKTIQTGGELSNATRAELAHAIQKSIVELLYKKLTKAAAEHSPTAIVIAGGVSANRALRTLLAVKPICNTKSDPIPTYFPTMQHAVDNGAMIGVAAALRISAGFDDRLRGDIRPRWPLEKRNENA